jgi:hypothetical protein
MPEITHKEIFTAIGRAIARTLEHHPGLYHVPYWGMKDTEHMKNLGFVIGYKDDMKFQSYRVDFDPNPAKSLHINWEQDTQDSTGAKVRVKECYLVRPHIISPEDEMYTWWRMSTMHHCAELPAEVSAKMGGKRIWRGAFWT